MNTRGDMPATGNNLDPQSAGYMSEFKGTVKVDDLGRWNSGMTIREQFAKAAMQGLLASGRVLDDELTEEATMAADMQLNHLERTK